MSEVSPQPTASDQALGSAAGHHSVCSHTTKGGQESSSEFELSHDEEDAPGEDENAEADKGGAETSHDSQVASDGEDGQACPQTQDTLTGVSQVFSTHEDTNPKEGIQSVWQKQHQTSPKEDSPPPPPRNPANHLLRKSRPQTRHSMMKQGKELSSWTHISMLGITKKIAKGITGWVTGDTMICDFPEHGKMQPNHPDPLGLPLDYMGECQVFDGIQSDIYDLCRFYTLGMTGDPPEFPTPREPVTHGQIRDLLKSACSIG